MRMCQKFFSYFFILTLTTAVGAQGTVSSVIQETSWLKSADQKKWQKLLGELNEAEVLLSESNSAYLKITNMNNSGDTDAAGKQKEIEKIEKDADEKAAKSQDIFRSVYKKMLEISDTYISSEQEQHTAYAEMVKYRQDAEVLYTEYDADKSDNTILSMANETQLLALEKSVILFTVPASGYQVETKPPREGDEYVINQGMLQRFSSYISDPNIPDPLTLNQLSEMNSSESDFSSFYPMWQNYVSSETGFLADQAQEEVQPDSLLTAETTELLAEVSQEENEESLHKEQKDNISENTTKQVVEKQTSEDHEHDILAEHEKDKITTSSQSDIKIRNKADSYTESKLVSGVSTDNKYEFRVQVAASRNPLSQSQIKAIYSGNLTVVEIRENNYYKYQITGFKTIPEAQKVCSASNVPNAYIEAYTSYKPASLAQAASETMTESTNSKTLSGNDVHFAVQVAATKVRLAPVKLKAIYPDTDQLNVVFEDGWYKYQIYAGNKMDQALIILKNCGVKDAFMVAYSNGEKIRFSDIKH
ncbi:MAG: SPOR domain-containing protein [Bacteroidales bacterium]|nr:SPOR domain-containing protein [Bacteroidales bacterium]MBN2818462.1 SPOR domain-containing protein [Bacteroidales bacterium]